MQSINIDVTKIDKAAIYQGKKGKYISLTLIDNRDGKDEYGNDGFVTQDLGKERRLAGEKGPILGNWKYIGQPTAQPKPTTPAPAPSQAGADDGFDEIPF